MLSQDFIDGCDRLQSSQTEAEVVSAIQTFIEKKGFWSFNLGYVDTLNHHVDTAPVKFISTMSEAWINHYSEQRYDLEDVGVQQIRKNQIKPVLLGHELRQDMPNLTDRQEQYIMDARDAGLTSAIIAPLMMKQIDQEAPPSGIGLVTNLKRQEFLKMWGESQGETLLFVNYMHQLLSVPIAQLMEGIEPLSARELDCLGYIALGLRPEQISDKLNIATVTVNVHIQRARKKLKAQTNAHAVAKAIRFQLI